MCFDGLVRTVIKTGNSHSFKEAMSDQIGTNTEYRWNPRKSLAPERAVAFVFVYRGLPMFRRNEDLLCLFFR